MKAIVVVDNNWAIGSSGGLLVHLPKDLKRFKKITEDSILIMGRKTLDSLPGGRPLPGREHWVLTRDKNYKNDLVKVIYSVDEVLELAKEQKKEVFVSGGGQIYKQLLPHCKRVIVTHINTAFDDCDTHFPNLEEHPDWILDGRTDPIDDNGYKTEYGTYMRR